MPAGRPTDKDRNERNDWEDGVLAELCDIPFALQALRIRLGQTLVRYPETRKILDGAEDEVENIERRTRRARKAASRFHNDNWGPGKNEQQQ
jgi:hypothetical protein